MADFSNYLNKPVESIEAPKPLPIGHYFATWRSSKGAERDYKTGEGKVPVWEATFTITSPDEDVDTDLLPEGGVNGKMVTKDYRLNDGTGQAIMRRIGEDVFKLPTKGLDLGDYLRMFDGQPCKVYIGHREGKGERAGEFFPQVEKVLPAD